jgi:hypothetical protein
MRFLFPRRSSAATVPGNRRWLASAYGAAADLLVDDLPALMERAAKEARSPRMQPSATPSTRGTAAAELLDVLTRLRSLTLSATVTGEDISRDLQLRAAMSAAVGAAHGLSLASSSQPTAGDLAHTWAGVNAVLIAAGRRGLAPYDAPRRRA